MYPVPIGSGNNTRYFGDVVILYEILRTFCKEYQVWRLEVR